MRIAIKANLRISPRLLYLFGLSIPVLSLVAGLWHLKGSWDDGAITAAFARTLAHSGRFALTASSVQVEGFSSLSWLVLLCLPAFVFTTSWILVWMKICSAAAFLFSLMVLRRIALRYLHSEWNVSAAVFLLAITITPFHESVNGMEMTLYMLLALVLTELLLASRVSAGREVVAVLVSCLLLSTRFEAPYLLVFLYGGLLLSGVSRRRLAVLCGVNLVFFAGVEMWRYHVFHLWMPNTVYAKQWQPYQPPHTLLRLAMNRVDGSFELLTVLSWPITVLFVLWVLSESFAQKGSQPKNRLSPPARLLSCMVCGGLLFSVLFGQNWGHPGRMILAFVPFIALSIIYFAENATLPGGYSRVRIIGVMLVGQFLGWEVQAARIVRHPDPISIELLEKEGKAADDVRVLLNKKTIDVLMPDVGGAALCCDKLTIHDSALLTNPYLAKRGYVDIGSYIRQLDPDVIVTHFPWSEMTQVYSNERTKRYGIVGAEGMRVLVRPDLYQALQVKIGPEVRVDDTPACQDDMMKLSEVDVIFATEKGVCLRVGDEVLDTK